MILVLVFRWLLQFRNDSQVISVQWMIQVPFDELCNLDL